MADEHTPAVRSSLVRPGPPPLLITIRFTTSIPDLPLTVSQPDTTTTLALIRQIRSHLTPEASNCRLRLIHAGKVLSNISTLREALNLPDEPSLSPRSADRKGKAAVRDVFETTPSPHVYIHCSIGDELSSSELAAEAAAAELSVSSRDSTPAPSTAQQQQGSQTTTTPAPRGFDRLLSAGFTPAEVAALRSQFLALQSHTHTPDTMPSGPELRALEDRWIDESGPDASTAAQEEPSGLDDMLWGNIVGFFWPVAVVWLLREEGVWSKRRQIAVFTGFLVNVAFSVLRFTS